MEVILLENIKKLGTIGQKVRVANGYARNFLLKKNKALLTTKENLEYFEKKKDEIQKKNEQEKQKALETLKKINSLKVTLKKEVMENGNLYGSVTVKEICAEIINVSKVEIKPEQIEIKKQIKAKGDYKLTVNLHAEVQAQIIVEIASKE